MHICVHQGFGDCQCIIPDAYLSSPRFGELWSSGVTNFGQCYFMRAPQLEKYARPAAPTNYPTDTFLFDSVVYMCYIKYAFSLSTRTKKSVKVYKNQRVLHETINFM